MRHGDARFCEPCGADLVGWVAEVTVDARRCVTDGSDALVAPVRPLVVIPLVDGPVTIGRRRRDDDPPAAIDLGGDRADPGVSRYHATIERAPDGTWTVTDDGSTNGTIVDDDDRSIPPHVPVTVVDGSRIHVGAWTTITIRSSPTDG